LGGSGREKRQDSDVTMAWACPISFSPPGISDVFDYENYTLNCCCQMVLWLMVLCAGKIGLGRLRVRFPKRNGRHEAAKTRQNKAAMVRRIGLTIAELNEIISRGRSF